MTPLQPQRYQQMVQKTKHIAQVKGLSPDFAQQLYDLIHEQSLKQQ
jgi:chorismate mutase